MDPLFHLLRCKVKRPAESHGHLYTLRLQRSDEQSSQFPRILPHFIFNLTLLSLARHLQIVANSFAFKPHRVAWHTARHPSTIYDRRFIDLRQAQVTSPALDAFTGF
jgi:hypothetical protein